MKHKLTAAATLCGLALATTACGGSGKSDSTAKPGGQDLKGHTITVAAVWTGEEQQNFMKVLDAFSKKTGAKVQYMSTGDNNSTVVGSKVAGGDAPDVDMVPQVGVLQQFAQKGWLLPLSPTATGSASANYAKAWRDFGTVNNTYYGLYFKASDKSTVWYDPKALDNAGVTPPSTYAQMLTDAKTVSDSGVAAFSIGGQDGWPLTDWFENIYLSQAGPDNYDKLAHHTIPWTDPTVVKALTTLAQLFGQDSLIAGGRTGALHTDFPKSVQEVFGDSPKAAMTYEGDFVSGNITDLKKKVGTDAKFFPFPSVDNGPKPVVGGGDAAVVLKAGKDSATAMRFVEFLATPEAASVWAKAGGFLSPNKQVAPSAYTDPTLRQAAASIVGAGDGVRFDMSDQTPAAFGGTQGTGEWKILQDFLRDPSNPTRTAAQLEAAAVKAYKG